MKNIDILNTVGTVMVRNDVRKTSRRTAIFEVRHDHPHHWCHSLEELEQASSTFVSNIPKRRV